MFTLTAGVKSMTKTKPKTKKPKPVNDAPVKAEIVREVERAFDLLNNDLFGSRLSRPGVIFQPKLHHTVRWFSDTNDLSIGSEVAEVPWETVLADLLHEMIHVYNAAEKVADCTSNAYHNWKFLSPALKVGLVVCHQKTQGWGITMLKVPTKYERVEIPQADDVKRREAAFERIGINQSVLRQAREYITALSAKKNGKVYFMKYTCGCPGPHNSIRCGRKPDGPNRLNAVCGFCNQPFQVVEIE